MTIRLIAIDIDDTLLNSQRQLLPSTKASIQNALEAGLKVVLCSGRPLAGVTPYLQALGIQGHDQYVITYNGSVIETVTGDVIFKTGLSHEAYQAIDAYSKRYQLGYYVLDSQSQVYTSNLDVDPVAVIQAYENQDGILIREPEQVAKEVTMIKAAFGGTAEKLDQHEARVQKVFGHDNTVVRAAPRFLEIMAPGVDKGAALSRLADHLHLSAQEVMAIGDERNDIPMFNFAKTAVAMGNASPAAKKHADFITSSNDEDGIALALEKFVFGK